MDELAGRIDEVCFEHRDALLIPCALPIAIALLSPLPPGIEVPLGLASAGAGSGLRLWAVRSIGKRARVRHAGARSLLVAGPYARVRNPLYLANGLLTLGLCLLAGAGWSSLLALLLLCLIYARVVAHEEVVLQAQFGPDYAAYVARVPRWIPRLRAATAGASPPPWPWAEVLRRERSVVVGVPAACGAALAIRAGLVPLAPIHPWLGVPAAVAAVSVAVGGTFIATEMKRRRHRRARGEEERELAPSEARGAARADLAG